MTAESKRIEFLLQRDGSDAARQWVLRTRDLYRAAVNSPSSHASTAEYKRLFEEAIRDYEQWLARQQP